MNSWMTSRIVGVTSATAPRRPKVSGWTWRAASRPSAGSPVLLEQRLHERVKLHVRDLGVRIGQHRRRDAGLAQEHVAVDAHARAPPPGSAAARGRCSGPPRGDIGRLYQGYSERITDAGSIRDARHAGTRLPASVITHTNPSATASVGPVRRRHADEQRLQRPPRRPRRRHAEHGAHRRQQHPLAQHHRQDPARCGADRHAHADLLRAIRHGERQQPVDADRRQQERQPGERQDHAELRAPRRHLRADDIVEEAHVRHRLLGIDLAHDGAQRRQQQRRIAARTHREILRRVEGQPAVLDLPVRHIHLRLAVALEPAHAHVTDDADDGALGEARP